MLIYGMDGAALPKVRIMNARMLPSTSRYLRSLCMAVPTMESPAKRLTFHNSTRRL